jgi:hypothetical protein
MDRYGETRYQRNVTARWAGNAARILEWTPRSSLAIEEEMTDENGRPVEETFDVEVMEATAVLGCPVDFTEPEVGSLVVITVATGVTKSFVCISKEKPEKAGSYVRMSVTLRNKQYVDYTVSTHS